MDMDMDMDRENRKSLLMIKTKRNSNNPRSIKNNNYRIQYYNKDASYNHLNQNMDM